MKLIKKEYVKVLEWSFRLAYLLLGLASFNVFLYDSPIQPLLVKICLVMGFLTLAGRLVFFKSYLKTPYWLVLMLFCLSFLTTIAVNRQYGAAMADLKWLVWTGVLFFLLYLCDGDREQKDYKREFTVFSNIMIVYSFFASAVGLYLMSQLYHEKWYTTSGELMLAGFQWGRLWGVYTDPNYGAVFSVAAVLLSAYYFKTLKGWKKIPYAAVILMDYLYIIFSDSRTSEVAMVVSVTFWILFTAIHRKRKAKGLAISILAAALFAGVFVGGTSYVKSQYNAEIQKQINAIDAAKKEKPNAQKKPVKKPINSQVGRAKDLQKDVSNGRLALWESGVEIWRTKPILGVGYNSFLPYVWQTVPETYAVNNSQGTTYISLHNEFVNILVYHGIVGFGIFMIFGILVIVNWIKAVKKIEDMDRDYMGVLVSCIIAIGVSMVFLLEGMHTNSPGTFILWTFLGYVMHYCTKIRKAD